MDLWIRSQDRKKLINVNELKIETVKDGNTFIYSDVTDLGTYSTKERALEVLEEIQMLLTPKMIIKNEGRDCVALDGTIYRTNLVSNVNSDIQQLSTYVYQMPEE